MEKKHNLKTLTLGILIGLAFAGLIALFAFGVKSGGNSEEKGVNRVFFGNVEISDYIMVSHNPISSAAAEKELNRLLRIKTGQKLKSKIRGGDYPYTIRLIVDKSVSDTRTVVQDGWITLYGKDSKALVKCVDEFANLYMDFAFAGSDREHLLSDKDVYNAATVWDLDTAWIKEREPIICLWKTNVPRGQFYNTGANLKSEILTYSDDQLYEYVKLMKACGFTGIQVTEMCSAWAQYSGYEFVHDRLRFMADAAHSMGMKFTLWVWGAEFNGYGWEDDSVVYSDYSKYTYSFECPEAYATFNKYYDIYAELADCSDRVILHYDDPSNIHNSVEIATYAKLLRDKFRAINPDINFGVSDYTNKYDKRVMAEILGDDATIYSGAVTEQRSSWRAFREDVKAVGCNLGVWSWNLCEMEIDQLAEMNVNANLIRDVYLRTVADGDDVMVPSYWSEMDSYHMANIFSLYCAGHLLQNPAEDSDELLREVANALVGSEYGQDLYEILCVIQAARTGSSWEAFKWNFDEYILTSDEYPIEEILLKCETLCGRLDEMIAADIENPSLPLPISVSDELNIVRTHLEQIRRFAVFRKGLEELKEMSAKGKAEAELIKKIDEISTPVPNFDAVVGVWGQPESLAQLKLLQEFCDENNIDMPVNSLYMYYLKQYIYQEICVYQKNRNTINEYGLDSSLWQYVIGERMLSAVIDSLVEDGLLVKSDGQHVYPVNWQDYTFAY